MGNKGYQVQPNLLFWIRLKTLQTHNRINQILQIAYIYTDMKLSICQSGSHIAIQCKKQILENSDSQQLQFYKNNGLYELCINSNIGMQAAQDLILKDFEFRNIARGQLLAAGKQVHLTKYVLMQHMPKLYDFLHYRIFDLDSVGLAVHRFKNDNQEPNQQITTLMSQDISRKKRAEQEVWQDIQEMKFYFQHGLNDN